MQISENGSNGSSECGKGNTIPSRDNGVKRWCFTLNNYTEKEHTDLIEWCGSNGSKYIIGEEMGENKTPHLQGYINLIKKSRLSALKKINHRIHWEQCKGSEDDNINYCSKDGKYKTNIKRPVPIRILKEEQLRGFQKWIIDLLKEPAIGGKIIWIYDPIGQCGKTQTLRYLNVKHKVPFAYGGKCNDIINLAFNNKEYLLNEDVPMFIYNIAREDNQKLSYSSMEQISDGCIANTKFEANCFVFNPPHVVVLANIKPDISKLTKSRWILKTIDENFEMKDLNIENNDLEL